MKTVKLQLETTEEAVRHRLATARERVLADETLNRAIGTDTATQRSPMRHEHRVTYTLVRSFEDFGSDAS